MTKRSLSALWAPSFRVRRASLRWRAVAIALLCAWIALAPGLAEARAGSSSSGRTTSQGSLGSRTYEGNGGAPMERSMTARPTPSPSAPQVAPGYRTPAYGGGGFMQRNPFMTGMLGGFLGAGLAGMIFGHSAMAADGSSSGSVLGMLLQFALIAGLIWLAVSLFRRRSSGMATAPAAYAGSVSAMAPPAPTARNPVEIGIVEADFTAWGILLTGIQDAWSRGDLAALRRQVTPEMLSYFSEQLSANASQGIENRVEHVNLLKGDLQEAWSDGDLEYATTRLHWSANDYMVSAAVQSASQGGQEVIVSGDPSRPVEATELWTFVRSHGGRWLLSAIQQI
jgi:predicted lipid-binding transport protein (Tim44 family)